MYRICLLFALSLCIFSPLNTHANNDIFISEIGFMGSTLSGNDKWIEIHNPTNSIISLSDYTLTTKHAGNFKSIKLTAVAGNSIAPQSTILLLNSSQNSQYSVFTLPQFNSGYKTGFINGISAISNPSQRYVSMNLIGHDGVILSSIDYDLEMINSFSIKFDKSISKTLECSPGKNACSLSNDMYSSQNYGTPGVVPILLPKQSDVEPTIVPAVSNIAPSQALSTSDVIQDSIKLKPNVESVETPSQVHSKEQIIEKTTMPSHVTNTFEPVPSYISEKVYTESTRNVKYNFENLSIQTPTVTPAKFEINSYNIPHMNRSNTDVTAGNISHQFTVLIIDLSIILASAYSNRPLDKTNLALHSHT